MIAAFSPLHRLARLLFWSAAAFALVMACLPQPVALLGDPGDKLLHIIAFAVLALLAAFAYPRVRLLTVLTGLSLFGIMIELVQLIPALNRTADWTDWAADTLAAAAVLGCVFLLRRLRRMR
jgi:VanZ family protein